MDRESNATPDSAEAPFLSAPAALAGPAAFGLTIIRFQIGPEERALGALFGSRCDDCLRSVRRWL